MQLFVITIFTNSWEKNIVYVGVNSSVKQYCFLISSTWPFGWIKGCVILKSGNFLLKQSYMDKTIEQIPRKVKREKLGMRCFFFFLKLNPSGFLETTTSNELYPKSPSLPLSISPALALTQATSIFNWNHRRCFPISISISLLLPLKAFVHTAVKIVFVEFKFHVAVL